jgi:hypothetical protein
VLEIGHGQRIFWPIGRFGQLVNGQRPKLIAKMLLEIGCSQVNFWPIWPLANGQNRQNGQDNNDNLFF